MLVSSKFTRKIGIPDGRCTLPKKLLHLKHAVACHPLPEAAWRLKMSKSLTPKMGVRPCAQSGPAKRTAFHSCCEVGERPRNWNGA
jgi:hypothetical protein